VSIRPVQRSVPAVRAQAVPGAALFAVLLLAALPARAEEPAPPAAPGGEPSTAELARAAQNPVADIISIPFQDNIGFGYGPQKDVQNVLNFQPVIPFHLTDDWNLITRTILPVVTQPSFTDTGSTTGLGNLTFTAFLSPGRPGAVIWGVGPVATFPTATSPVTGSQSTWGLGPSAVVLAMPGRWVLGALVNNVWSVAGARSNTFLLQYFVNYNFGNTGWYLTTSPIVTANWEAAAGQQWVVPFGAGAGKLLRLGKLPVNVNLSAYWNAWKPDVGPDWTLRVQVSILLPTSIFR
jgi:hypothetical protein